ncbi:hypothetical protein TNCV_4903701 [Trichonephila clavipes]|uniref:Uncharacterized protein n=1 Tax=Trichonephila clavipes TaxID=2585209 RepID=A0A8X6SHL0_TRICX|nr:hypothetical protein TNCV_4903701 [Trichonephila clavipes]
MSESRIKLCGHNKNISFLIGDGVCRQGKVMRQHPKQGQFSKAEQSNASASQVMMVSKDRVKLYGYNKSVNFFEDGLKTGISETRHFRKYLLSKNAINPKEQGISSELLFRILRNYFLYGYVNPLVYADKPQTLHPLENNIRRVIADIRPQMLEKSSKVDVQIGLHPSQPWQSYARNHIKGLGT